MLLSTLIAGPVVTVAALAMRVWTGLGELGMALRAARLGRAAAARTGNVNLAPALGSAMPATGLPTPALDEEPGA